MSASIDCCSCLLTWAKPCASMVWVWAFCVLASVMMRFNRVVSLSPLSGVVSKFFIWFGEVVFVTNVAIFCKVCCFMCSDDDVMASKIFVVTPSLSSCLS